MSVLTFTPVIEIEPWGFSRVESPRIVRSGEEGVKAWREYSEAAWADGGFGELNPVASDSFMFVINSLRDSHFTKILDDEFEDIELVDDWKEVSEQLCALYGGLAFFLDSTLVCEPACCGDLTQLRELGEMLQDKSPEWQAPWNGHDGNEVALRYQNEIGSWDLQVRKWNSSEVYHEIEVSDQYLNHQFEQCRLIINQCVERLIPLLNEITPHNQRECAEILLGVSCP